MSGRNRVGLIGSGLMGKPMGLNWLKKDFKLNVIAHKKMGTINELKAAGAHEATDLQSLAQDSDFIILMLPTSREVESVTDELSKYLTPKHVTIDMSTSEPQSTKDIARKFERKNLKFFDSPVTGGVKGAVEGTLTLFIGGPREYYLDAREVLSAVSKIQTHFGDVGQGHVAKIINNIVCIGNLAVFAEALPLAAKMGLNTRDIYQTLATGTGASRMLDLYGVQILNGDFAPRYKMAHAYKDILLAQNLVSEFKVSLPVLEGVIEELKTAMKENLGEENISSLIKLAEKQLHAQFRSENK